MFSKFFRTALTGADNQSYDIARIGFGMIIVGWFIALMTFVFLQAYCVLWEKHQIEAYSSGVVALFATLAAVLPCASWAVRIKSETEPEPKGSG